MSSLQRTFIVLLGAPGAGKGTQAERLETELALPHVATGDLFRAALKNGTPLGLLAKSYMDKGQLVPDQVTIDMVRERLAQPDCQKGAILDGFPRTVEQAKALDALLAESGDGISIAPYVKVSEQVLMERLGGRWVCRKCGATYHMLYKKPAVAGVCDACGGELYQRADDTPETQKHRIDVYLQETAPLIEFYAKKGLLAELDGEKDIDGVYADLVAVVKHAMGQRA
jgi:adenylate kinase